MLELHAMKILISILILSGLACAELPDAPHPSARCGPFACWNSPAVSNRDIFKSKSYWAFIGTDFLAASFDAEMSHHQGHCVEGSAGLPLHPTRAELYRHNLPEEGAVILFGYIWIRAKGPKWVLPLVLGYPVQAHVRAGLNWRNCW